MMEGMMQNEDVDGYGEFTKGGRRQWSAVFADQGRRQYWMTDHSPSVESEWA